MAAPDLRAAVVSAADALRDLDYGAAGHLRTLAKEVGLATQTSGDEQQAHLVAADAAQAQLRQAHPSDMASRLDNAADQLHQLKVAALALPEGAPGRQEALELVRSGTAVLTDHAALEDLVRNQVVGTADGFVQVQMTSPSEAARDDGLGSWSERAATVLAAVTPLEHDARAMEASAEEAKLAVPTADPSAIDDGKTAEGTAPSTAGAEFHQTTPDDPKPGGTTDDGTAFVTDDAEGFRLPPTFPVQDPSGGEFASTASGPGVADDPMPDLEQV